MGSEQVPFYAGLIATVIFTFGILTLLRCGISLAKKIRAARRVLSSKGFATLLHQVKLEKLQPVFCDSPFGSALKAHVDSLVETSFVAPRVRRAPGVMDLHTLQIKPQIAMVKVNPVTLSGQAISPNASPIPENDIAPSEIPETESVAQQPADVASAQSPTEVPGAEQSHTNATGQTVRQPDDDCPTETVITFKAPISARFSIARANNIHHWLWSDTLRHIPGILTGIGIVGTFYGIYQGLRKMRESLNLLGVTNPEKQVQLITDAVNQLFGHVSPAFLASMVCVTLAVFFTLIEKLVSKILLQYATGLASKVDQVFPIIQSDKIMLDISDRSEQSATDLRTALGEIVSSNMEKSLRALVESQNKQTETLATSLTGSITDSLTILINQQTTLVASQNMQTETLERSLKGSITDSLKELIEQQKALVASQNKQTETLASSLKGSIAESLTELVKQQKLQNELLGTSISTALTEQLSPMSSTLADAVKQIKSESSNSTADTMREMAGEFRNALASSAGGQLDELARTLQGSADLMVGQKTAMTDFIDATRQQMLDQSQMVQNALRQNGEQQTEQTKVLAQQMSATLKEVQNALNTMAEANTQKSQQGLQAIGDTVNVLLERILTMQENSDARINDSIENSRVTLSDQINHFQDATSRQITNISTTVDDVSQKLSSNAASLVNDLRQNTQASVSQFSEKMYESTQSAMQSLAGQVQSSLNSMEAKTSSLMEATTASQAGLVAELSGLSQKIASASHETNQSTQASVAQFSEKMVQSTQTAMQSLTGQVQSSLDSIEAKTTSLLEVTTASQKSLVAELSGLSQKIASASHETNQSNQASVSRFSEKMVESTQAAMESLTGQVQSSLSSIEATTTNLIQATTASQKSLVAELSGLAQKIASASNETTQSSLAVARQTHETVVSLGTMSKNFETTLNKLDSIGVSFTQVGGRLVDASTNLRVHSEKAAEQTTASAHVVAQLNQIHSQLQLQLAMHDSRLQSLQGATVSMKQTTDALAAVHQQVSQALNSFTAGSERVFHTISEKQEQHGRAVAEMLKTYLKSFDQSLADSCSGLQAIVEELSGSLEEFREDRRPGQNR